MPFFYEANFVVDFKLNSSGQSHKMKTSSFTDLKRGDYIKFVCGDKQDVDQAIAFTELLLDSNCKADYAIGQTWEWLQKKDFNLYKYLLEKNINYFVLNYQLHKLLNLD
jgi:hypothetical protein